MDKKAQGALEYLLLIGGAVLVAVIIIALLMNLSQGSTGDSVNNAQAAVGTRVQNAVDTLPK